MRLDQKGKFITLDWDNISIVEARRRTNFILDNYANVRKLVLSLSPTKGYHVRLYCYSDTLILPMRKALKDDGRRIIHDIFNRSDNIHDILWIRKTDSRGTWEEKELLTVTR